jgi:hypothetical protein
MGYGGTLSTTFNLGLDDFYYSFPVGSRLDVIVGCQQHQTDDFVTSTIVPFDGPSVADAGGPVLYDANVGGGGFAAGFSFAITDNFVFDAGYSAHEGPTLVFTGSPTTPMQAVSLVLPTRASIAQLSYLSDGVFDAALVYINGMQPVRNHRN